MSLRTKMAFFLLFVAIIPSIAVISLFKYRVDEMLEEKTDNYVDKLLDERTISINEYIDCIDNIIFTVRTQESTLQYMREVTPENYREVESRLLTSEIAKKLEFCQTMYPKITYIGVFSMVDGLDISRGTYFSDMLRNIKQEENLNRVSDNPQVTFCRLYKDSVTGKPYLLLFAGIVNKYNEQILGYIAVRVNIDDYFRSVLGISNSDYTFFVEDENENMIYPADYLGRPASEILPEITDSKYGYLRKSLPLDLTEWKITVIADLQQESFKMQKTTALTIMLAGIFAVVAVVGAVYFYFKIYVPIKTLTDMMTNLESDVFELESPVTGKDELGQLGFAFNRLIQRVNRQVEEIAQTEKQKNEMEIKALQAQITPHFLYNTLNTIKCMARLNKTDGIVTATESLIDLLRVISGNDKLITIENEIQYLEDYCTLMSLRSGAKYDVLIHVNEDVSQFLIPKLSLQPFVENSILHGTNTDNPNLTIEISVTLTESTLIITLSDNGCGVTQEVLERINTEKYEDDIGKRKLSGIGIGNVRQRLQMEYGNNSKVIITNNVKGGTDVQISIPLNPES